MRNQMPLQNVRDNLLNQYEPAIGHHVTYNNHCVLDYRGLDIYSRVPNKRNQPSNFILGA